jgi:hypothetical protein
MSRPGTLVTVSDEIPPVAAATDTSVGFMVGEAEHGPTDTVLVRSVDSWRNRFGERSAPTAVFDAVDSFFRDRGSRLYFRRLTDGATAASVVAEDADDDEIFTVTATEVGAWGNGLTLELVSPSAAAALARTRARPRLELVARAQDDDVDDDVDDGADDGPEQGAAVPAVAVVRRGTQVLERSVTLATTGDLVAWSAGAAYVRVTAPDETVALTLGAHALAGGLNGTVPVTDPDALLDACLAIDPALGPGQLTAPGKTALGQHEAVLRGADFGNRVAYLDADPAADEATLTAHVRQLRTLEVDRCGGLFAPRAVIPGLAINTRRIVPWSGIQAGLTAHRDTFGNIAQPAAGRFGMSRAAFDLEREYDDDARERLMLAGVNTARIVQQSVRGYGFRSLVDPEGPRRAWLQLSGVRTAMAIKAEGDAEAENYVFAVLDGRLRKIAEFGGALSGICLRYWQNDALFGLTSEEAFRVNVGDAVNTPETIADGQLRAVLLLKVAPFAEFVEVQIVKQAITEALA